MAVVCPQGAGRDVPMPRGMACRMTPDPTGPPAEGLVEGQACGRRTGRVAWLQPPSSVGAVSAIEKSGRQL
jgi:hypothetical protein